MEFFADWHIHSTYSDGRGTIEENVLAALAKGLKEIAITDHGPNNIGVGVDNLQAYTRIQEEVLAVNQKCPEITVKTGAEANIIALDGSIDIPYKVMNLLDILIVGLHPYVYPSTANGGWSFVGLNQLARFSRSARDKARVNNTKTLKEAVARNDVDFISHPNLGMPVDIAELGEVCATYETALEINTGHHYDKEVVISQALKTGVKFVVNSDAHFPETVGELSSGGILLEKYNIPKERVLNA